MSKPNVRGKGKKDARISQLEGVIEKQQAQIAELVAKIEGRAQDAHATNAFTAPVGMIRRRQVRAHAYDLYVSMGGNAIDQQLRNALLKARAFSVQIRAAEIGKPEAAYGPNITPYEDRMSGSLVTRLIKSKKELFDVCLAEATLDADECAELGEDFDSVRQPAPQDPATQANQNTPRLNFSDEEKGELLDWLKAGQPGNPPPVADDIQRAIMYGRLNPRQMPTDLIVLVSQIEELQARNKPQPQPTADVG